MNNCQKKRWIVPKLVILARNQPGEYLASGCKNSTAVLGPCLGVGKCNANRCTSGLHGTPGCNLFGPLSCAQNYGNCFGNSAGTS